MTEISVQLFSLCRQFLESIFSVLNPAVSRALYPARLHVPSLLPSTLVRSQPGVGFGWTRLGVHRPTFADEFRRAVAVAIANARGRFAQDDAECDTRAGHGRFTNSLHAGTSVHAAPGSMTVRLCQHVCRARSASRFMVAQLNFRKEESELATSLSSNEAGHRVAMSRSSFRG